VWGHVQERCAARVWHHAKREGLGSWLLLARRYVWHHVGNRTLSLCEDRWSVVICNRITDVAVYQSTRDIMRCKLSHARGRSLPVRALMYRAEAYNVAVHMRVGDLELHTEDKDFWSNIWRNVMALTEQFEQVDVHVFAQGRHDLLNRTFSALNGQRVRKIFVTDMTEADVVYHMMNAHLLVCTGSGFPLVAASVSWKPVVMSAIFQAMSERHLGAYIMEDMILLDMAGNLIRPTLTEGVSLVAARYQQLGNVIVP
jgi:hypothetical protein